MRRVLLATAAAFAAATGIFVTLVLPAEFAVDPTGVGKALGLTGLAGTPPEDIHRTAAELADDVRTFELAPFESVEFKYHLAAGDGLVYAWSANAEVVFDLHAEPEDAAPDASASYAQGRAQADAGTYVARFGGVHGWFWENRGASTVRVHLRIAGFATGATHYYDGRAQQAQWPPTPGQPAPPGTHRPR